MFRLDREKYFFRIDLKIGCYVIAYLLLASHITLAAWVIYVTVTKTPDISLKDPDAMKKLTKILLLGQFLFPVAITLIKFDIILFKGLSGKSRFKINVYLVFAKYALMAFTIACMTYQLYYPLYPYANVAALSIPIQAYFLHVMRRYWKQLEPKNTKLQHSV